MALSLYGKFLVWTLYFKAGTSQVSGLTFGSCMQFIKFNKISVIVNKDYTPFSIERDEKIERVCNAKGVKFIQCDDILLLDTPQVNKAGKYYKIFSAFTYIQTLQSLPAIVQYIHVQI